MSERHMTDRVLVGLAGLGLAAGGLVLVDWHPGRVLDLAPVLRTTSALDLLDRTWWPWAQAGAGVLLALLALWWLLAHLPRRGPGRLDLPAPEGTDRVALATGPLGEVLAERVESTGALDHAHVDFRRHRGATTATVRARVQPDADLASVRAAVAEVATEVGAALPGPGLAVQFRVAAPRRAGTNRRSHRGTVRLQ